MCGILGIVSLDDRPLDVEDAVVLAMRDSMTARGPDDSGLIRPDARTVLAHRRLSIRDPEHGQQPWVSEDGRYSLTYNGELYNSDLLNERTADRFSDPLRTRCDTELLMRSLIVDGPAALNQLNGMFAFGFYDAQRKSLLLARDRFGIKPLYYASWRNMLIFASSLKAIRSFPGFPGKLDRTAVMHYLMTLRPQFGDQTLIKRIKQLPPGHYLELNEDGIKLRQYWNYPDGSEAATFDETEERFANLFATATDKRIVSDVPVGMMLSGGVDSSLLGTYVEGSLGADFVAKCGVGESEDSLEETQFAEQAAQHLNCRFEAVRVSADDYLSGWRELIAESGQPLATPSDVIIYRLAQSLKQEVGVVLGGEGADELFCGYTPIHGIGRDYDLLRQLSSAKVDTSQVMNLRRSIANLYQIEDVHALADLYLALATVIPTEALQLLVPDAGNSLDEIETWYREQLAIQQSDPAGGLNAVTKFLHQQNLQTLLMRLDRATMAASLEARVPFTDYQLVEAIWTTPLEHRFRVNSSGGSGLSIELENDGQLEAKAVLRSLARRRLPENLANRQKASFPTPVYQWLCDDWKTWAGETISQSGWLREMCDLSVLDEILDSPEQTRHWIWPLLNLAMWHESA